jgi:hypothetical protein
LFVLLAIDEVIHHALEEWNLVDREWAYECKQTIAFKGDRGDELAICNEIEEYVLEAKLRVRWCNSFF